VLRRRADDGRTGDLHRLVGDDVLLDRQRLVGRDTPAEAEAVADYLWLLTYPGEAHPDDPYSIQHPYWSMDCMPGGPLDVRAPGTTLWP
jgi:hypothetical protein